MRAGASHDADGCVPASASDLKLDDELMTEDNDSTSEDEDAAATSGEKPKKSPRERKSPPPQRSASDGADKETSPPEQRRKGVYRCACTRVIERLTCVNRVCPCAMAGSYATPWVPPFLVGQSTCISALPAELVSAFLSFLSLKARVAE